MAKAGSTTVNIPLTSLAPGTYWFPLSGGQALQDSYTLAYLSIDRTVSGGLNALAATVTIALTIFQSNDAGATWRELAADIIPGGTYILHETGQPETASDLGVSFIPGTGRQAKASVVVTGGTVAVQGSLVLS